MNLTIPYYDSSRHIAAPLSDPLCQMLAAEEAWDEIDALISSELAAQHVKPTHEDKE